jgi:hypothetical protein
MYNFGELLRHPLARTCPARRCSPVPGFVALRWGSALAVCICLVALGPGEGGVMKSGRAAPASLPLRSKGATGPGSLGPVILVAVAMLLWRRSRVWPGPVSTPSVPATLHI